MVMSLFDAAEALGEDLDAVVLRVLGADVEHDPRVGATRIYRAGRDPLGSLHDPTLHAVLDPLAERHLRLREGAHLLRLAAAGQELVVVVQTAADIPPVAWDLLRAGCPVVLHTRAEPGGLVTTAAVPAPPGTSDEPFPTSSSGSGRSFVERLQPRPQLAVVGHGVLADALVDGAALLRWRAGRLPGFSPGDIQHLGPADVLLVVVDDPETRWRAALAALHSGVGYTGVVCPAEALAGTPPSPRDGLHLLSAGDVGASSPHESALLVLEQVLAHRCAPTLGADQALLVF